MIKPTVGRIVWLFYESSLQGPPLAAIVTCVWSDTCVNLAIFTKEGGIMENPPTSIRLLQDDERPPVSGYYCAWMPYQVGQAKKYEELKQKTS